MKFSEMKYERPNYAKLYDDMKALLGKMQGAKSTDEFVAALMELDKLSDNFATMSTLCSIRNSINTKDEFYEKETDVMNEETPRFGEIYTAVASICLNTPFKADLEKKFGKYFLEKAALSEKTFSPAVVEDLVEENKLGTAYQKLLASAEIEFDGKTYNLTGMGPFALSKDRDVRRRASVEVNKWLADRVGELDDLYDKLVKVRVRIAEKLGFSNFVELAYARMGRTDWNMQDARLYRKQILESVVPLTQKLIAEQRERLGIADMKYYDYALSFLSGNPTPKGDEEHLVNEAKKMYHELSRETGEFFDMMISMELMDLATKPGKAGGGYMTFLPDYKVPFIFANFNGTSHDVDVLTHEAGHAFQGWVQRNVSPSILKDMTMEVAEVHSMSMEFFTHPWLESFFKEDTEKYYYDHVAAALRFLPYGASIDEFQEWVFLNPNASPAERRQAYRDIEKKYLPHLEYDDCEYLEKGGRWQRQAHVYGMPFYYLDYTISQVVAFQYFVWDMKDHKAAWESYMKICELAGTVPFTELAQVCGLKNPFKEGCIASITPALEKFMDGLDKSKIK